MQIDACRYGLVADLNLSPPLVLPLEKPRYAVNTLQSAPYSFSTTPDMYTKSHLKQILEGHNMDELRRDTPMFPLTSRL